MPSCTTSVPSPARRLVSRKSALRSRTTNLRSNTHFWCLQGISRNKKNKLRNLARLWSFFVIAARQSVNMRTDSSIKRYPDGDLLFQKNHLQRLFMGIADKLSILFCVLPDSTNSKSIGKCYLMIFHSPPLREPPMRIIRPLCFNFLIW